MERSFVGRSMSTSSVRGLAGVGTTRTSSVMNSTLRTQDVTGRANSLFNMSICSNATTVDTTRSTTVMCLVKGRGKAITETGIASMDLRRNILRMSQFCDDQLYNQLMTKVHMLDPVEIVVAATLRESSVLHAMFDKLNRNFPAAKIQCVPRRYMNENKGKDYINKLCSPDSSGVDIALKSKVYALLAVSGLLSYIEDSLSMYLAPKTMRMLYHSGVHCMLIEHGTAVNLELLRPTGACTETPSAAQSVYSVLNHTNTLTGALTLRSNLLEPPTDTGLIEARYDAVEELLDDIEMFTSLQSALVKFPDIEKVITLSIQIPKAESRATAESKIRNILCLKTALDLVPCLSEILRTAKTTLLINLRKNLRNEGLERVLTLIVDKLNANATVTSGLLSMRGQIVFAVKTGLDGKLDAMRNVYNSLIDEIEEVVQRLSETYQLTLKLAFTNQRGFHVTYKIPKNSEIPDLPQEFIKVNKSRGMISMTTDKLIILNARITECLECIYNLSNRIVSGLLTEVHKEIPCLNSLVTSIGNLDMITSFALISRHPDYVRPEIGELLALKSARHPVAEGTRRSAIVPNDVYLSPETNFIIITGANNSGKSFYLRTIAVVQVIAQIGCFVPASFAMIRICDQLFSRIGSDNSATDNLESSFTVEMKEIAFVLKHKTPTALIILDELCRGTSSHEGIDICFSICKQLLQTSAFSMFATHFKDLCQLEEQFNNCSNFCFVTEYRDVEGSVAQQIVNDHKLKKGIAKGSRYGLKLAATMNFPKQVIEDAFRIADELERTQLSPNKSLEESILSNSSKSSKSKLESKIYTEMRIIAKHSGDIQDKMAALQHLKNKYAEAWQVAEQEESKCADDSIEAELSSSKLTSPTKSGRSFNSDSKLSGWKSSNINQPAKQKSDKHLFGSSDDMMGPPKRLAKNISSADRRHDPRKSIIQSSSRSANLIPVCGRDKVHLPKSIKIDQSFMESPRDSMFGNNGQSSKGSKQLNTTMLDSSQRQRRPNAALSQGLDRSHHDPTPRKFSGQTHKLTGEIENHMSTSMKKSATLNVFTNQSEARRERAHPILANKNTSDNIANQSSESDKSTCHNVSNTTKLVDYSLSPIAASGSVMCYPHSVQALSPVYKASTRRYREPVSPIHSDSMELSATSQWQGSVTSERSAGRPNQSMSGLNSSNCGLSRASTSVTDGASTRRNHSPAFFHTEFEQANKSLAEILQQDGSRSSLSNPYAHLFDNQSASEESASTCMEEEDIMTKLFGRQQVEPNEESCTDELVQKILTQAQHGGDNSSSSADVVLSLSRSTVSSLRSAPPEKLRKVTTGSDQSAVPGKRQESTTGKVLSGVSVHDGNIQDGKKEDRVINMNKTMRSLAEIDESSEKETSVMSIHRQNHSSNGIGKQNATSQCVTTSMFKLAERKEAIDLDPTTAPSDDGGLSPILASSLHHKSMQADCSANESPVQTKSDHSPAAIIRSQGSKYRGAMQDYSNGGDTAASTSAELVNTASHADSSNSSKKKSVTFRDSPLVEDIRFPTDTVIESQNPRRRLIDSLLDNTVRDSSGNQGQTTTSEDNRESIPESVEEKQSKGLLEDLLSQTGSIRASGTVAPRSEKGATCFSSVKIEPI